VLSSRLGLLFCDRAKPTNSLGTNARVTIFKDGRSKDSSYRLDMSTSYKGIIRDRGDPQAQARRRSTC
jgi:hypothetical protein